MQTLHLLINEKVYQTVMEMLSKFRKEDVEVITENEQYLSLQKYLQNELNIMNEGKATYHTIDDLENSLESEIRKHEN